MSAIGSLTKIIWKKQGSTCCLLPPSSLAFRLLHGTVNIQNSVPIKTKEGETSSEDPTFVRLSKLISSYSSNYRTSRRAAERLIREGSVTISGVTETQPYQLINLEDARLGGVKVGGRRLSFDENAHKAINSPELSPLPRVWLVHKLRGELVTESDPDGRPCLLERLRRGGVGRYNTNKTHIIGKEKTPIHLKPVGRLDAMSEGLVVLTDCGQYARQLELPKNSFHRVYRARVHGMLTPSKAHAIRRGLTVNGIKYSPMLVEINDEKGTKTNPRRNQRRLGGRRRASTNVSSRLGPSNKWLRVTCTEGKNRQIRKIFEHLGLSVTRLIRISFGDYFLDTIPPGMAIEIPAKPIKSQQRRGKLVKPMNRRKSRNEKSSQKSSNENETIVPVQWIRRA